MADEKSLKRKHEDQFKDAFNAFYSTLPGIENKPTPKKGGAYFQAVLIFQVITFQVVLIFKVVLIFARAYYRAGTVHVRNIL